MWHKYPNPHCSHVVTVDVIDRSVDPTTGAIRTERVLGCKQRSPAWIVKVRFSSSHSGQVSLPKQCVALRWFGGCVCPRGLLRGPINANNDHFLRQPLTLPICDMSRKDSLFP